MEEVKPITIGKILKYAVNRWKLFVPLTLSIGVVGTLLISFVYNPLKANYVGNFSYSNLDLQKSEYVDGSSFSYLQLISEDNLNKIKDAKEEYKSIDVAGMVKTNRISISRTVDKDNVVTDSSGNNQNYKYTLELNRRYFSSQELAASFAKDIANSAIEQDKEVVNNYIVGQDFSTFDSLSSFEEQIKMLVNQAKSLNKLYDKYTKTDSINAVRVSDRIYSLAVAAQQHLDNVFPNGTDTSLISQISIDGFVKDYSAIDLTTYKSQLEQEKSDNEQLLLVYTNQISSMAGGAAITNLPEKVNELTNRNAEIVGLLNSATAKIDNKSKYDAKDPEYMAKYNAFVSSISSYKQLLLGESESYKSFLRTAYIDSGKVSFEKSNVVEQKGNISIVISIVLSLLAGALVAGTTNIIIDRKKLRD